MLRSILAANKFMRRPGKNGYYKRNPDMPMEDQAQLWRYLGDVLCLASGGIYNMTSYHGGGSPIMEPIAITSQYAIESRKKLVWYIAGMSGGDHDALSKKATSTGKAPAKAAKR